jgi:hypothetical protein
VFLEVEDPNMIHAIPNLDFWFIFEGHKIVKFVMNDELERMLMWAWSILWYYYNICLQVLRKTMKNISEEAQIQIQGF